jgi:co-chaperonin GroES (HSP10)
MESVTIKPSLDRLLIERIVEEKTTSGIFLPKDTETPIARGRVVARGEGQWHDSGNFIKPNAEVGDTVLYAYRRGFEVEANGKKLAILNSVDILGIVESG